MCSYFTLLVYIATPHMLTSRILRLHAPQESTIAYRGPVFSYGENDWISNHSPPTEIQDPCHWMELLGGGQGVEGLFLWSGYFVKVT